MTSAEKEQAPCQHMPQMGAQAMSQMTNQAMGNPSQMMMGMMGPQPAMNQAFCNQMAPLQQQVLAMNPATQTMCPQQQMLMQQMCSPMMYMNFVKMMMMFVQNGGGMA